MTMEVIVSYVLIVVGWLGGAVNGAAISTQEFTSAERCEAARLALIVLVTDNEQQWTQI